MKVSQLVQAVPPSATLAVTSRAKEMKAQGIDVLGFAAGEPDFDTPEFIKNAAVEALKKGLTKYTPAAGMPDLRKAIAEKLKKENNLNYTWDQVVVNIGAKHSIYMAMQTVLDPGDEVLLPAPFWVTYPEAIKLAKAKAVVMETDSSTNYKITAQQLKAAITDKTALLVLNSPSNPGGVCYSPEELKSLADVLVGTNVMVLSDEIYERLVYGDTKFVSFAALSEDAYNRTLTVNGFSKAFSMTGWRLGYTAGPLNVMKAMARLQDHVTSNPVTFTQYAAIEALKDPAGAVETMRKEFEKRGVFMAEKLNAVNGIDCRKPEGAFYCFPDVSAHYGRTIGGAKITNSMEFAAALLEQAKVAVVPGDPFGSPKNVRLSFACSMEQIEKGINRMQEWLES
jgi:aspartate aminotransferase